MEAKQDDVFLPFYGFRSVPGPELTEEELDAIAEAADRYYENLACG